MISIIGFITIWNDNSLKKVFPPNLKLKTQLIYECSIQSWKHNWYMNVLEGCTNLMIDKKEDSFTIILVYINGINRMITLDFINSLHNCNLYHQVIIQSTTCVYC